MKKIETINEFLDEIEHSKIDYLEEEPATNKGKISNAKSDSTAPSKKNSPKKKVIKIEIEGRKFRLRKKYGQERIYNVVLNKNIYEEDFEKDFLLGKDTTNSRLMEGNFGQSDLKDFIYEELPDFIDELGNEYDGYKSLSQEHALDILERVKERIKFFMKNGLD